MATNPGAPRPLERLDPLELERLEARLFCAGGPPAALSRALERLLARAGA